MMQNQHQPAPIGTSGHSIQLTAEQKFRLDTVSAMMDIAYADDPDAKTVALNAVFRYLNTEEKDREGTIESAGEDIARARRDLTEAYAAARAITILAIEDGKSEVAMSQVLGVDRMTIRKWVGKAR